jgi:hypothetical protein
MSLYDPQGREIYSWTVEAPKPKLESGETVAFRAKLVSPPLTSRDVLVRFAGSEDMRQTR